MDQRRVIDVEEPRHEPEIIPPRAPRAFEGRQRIFVTRVGPVGLFAALLLVGVLALVAMLLLLGMFLISIPIVALLLAGAIIGGWWRGVFRRRHV
jgi:hypothetical protein